MCVCVCIYHGSQLFLVCRQNHIIWDPKTGPVLLKIALALLVTFYDISVSNQVCYLIIAAAHELMYEWDPVSQTLQLNFSHQLKHHAFQQSQLNLQTPQWKAAALSPPTSGQTPYLTAVQQDSEKTHLLIQHLLPWIVLFPGMFCEFARSGHCFRMRQGLLFLFKCLQANYLESEDSHSPWRGSGTPSQWFTLTNHLHFLRLVHRDISLVLPSLRKINQNCLQRNLLIVLRNKLTITNYGFTPIPPFHSSLYILDDRNKKWRSDYSCES